MQDTSCSRLLERLGIKSSRVSLFGCARFGRFSAGRDSTGPGHQTHGVQGTTAVPEIGGYTGHSRMG